MITRRRLTIFTLKPIKVLTAAFFLTASTVSYADTYSLQSASFMGPPIIGNDYQVEIAKGDTMAQIARQNGMGLQEILDANPGIKPRRMMVGDVLSLPKSHILPDTERGGIVVNLPEMRMYYYPDSQSGHEVMTFPVTIGQDDWPTPQKRTTITQKVENPTWRPTKRIRLEAEGKGIDLPEVVPAGPKNPLGRHKMRLGQSSILIHGTNKPSSIGLRASHGCLRMYPEDVEKLFNMVPMGIDVQLINQPIKVTEYNGRTWVEVHKPLGNDPWSDKQMLDYAVQHFSAFGHEVDIELLKELIATKSGIPTIVPENQIYVQR